MTACLKIEICLSQRMCQYINSYDETCFSDNPRDLKCRKSLWSAVDPQDCSLLSW
jgi:hypothetical protein